MRVKYWQYWQLLSSLISPTLSSFFPGGTAHVVQLASASLVCNYITQIYGVILMYSVMVGIILHGCVQLHHSDSSNIIKGRIQLQCIRHIAGRLLFHGPPPTVVWHADCLDPSSLLQAHHTDSGQVLGARANSAQL